MKKILLCLFSVLLLSCSPKEWFTSFPTEKFDYLVKNVSNISQEEIQTMLGNPDGVETRFVFTDNKKIEKVTFSYKYSGDIRVMIDIENEKVVSIYISSYLDYKYYYVSKDYISYTKK